VAAFATGQSADLMLSGVGFNETSGPLVFNHPSGIASDGTRLAVCDRFNNRVLLWNRAPLRWDEEPSVVLGQPDFFSNNPGIGKDRLNWPGNASLAANGVLAVADTENDRILIWRQWPARNAAPADVSLFLPAYSQRGHHRLEWPWGVWTDGSRLAAVATHGATVLFWSTLPTADNAPPDSTLSRPEFGTPRNISTDGANYFFVGDHNARTTGFNGSATFFWNSYPAAGNPPFDFAFQGWIKGCDLPGGAVVAAGMSTIHVWPRPPRSAADLPTVSFTHPSYRNGDGVDVAFAAGRLYVNNYNGNNVLVYDGVPSSPSARPAFALGSPSPEHNTLRDIHYLQNPVVATDGRMLIASSDFDQEVWVWRSLPRQSGAAPDARISLKPHAVAPSDNALHGGRFVAAGKDTIAVWERPPLDGSCPDRVLRPPLGGNAKAEVRGVALDAQFLYAGDSAGRLHLWRGIPATSSEPPARTLMIEPPLSLLHSDGIHLCVTVQHARPRILVYRVADFLGGADVRPVHTVEGGRDLRLNLCAGAIIFDGALAIANTCAHSVLIWPRLEEAGNPASVIVLGQPSLQSTDPAIGRDRLFMPASLAWDGHGLWVGESKFSSRILRFTPPDSARPR